MRQYRLTWLFVAAVAGCAPAAAPTIDPPTSTAAPATPTNATPSAATTPSAAATPSAATTPNVTAGPRESGLLTWPAVFDVPLARGTYSSSPPFDIPFTITIAEEGWFSGHADPEFFDLLRFDGVAVHEWPSQMIAFGDVDHVRGSAGSVHLAGLTPAQALDALADRADLDTDNAATQSLLGLGGARLDIHSEASNNPLIGKGFVELRQGPQLDIRLVLLGYRDGMLMVGVLAPPGGVEAAWERALPILATVQLGD